MVLTGINDTSQAQCTAAANQRGGHIRCDLAVDHSGWAHSNREHELIWDGRGPAGALRRETAERRPKHAPDTW